MSDPDAAATADAGADPKADTHTDADARILGAGTYAPRARLAGDAVAEAWGRFQPRGVDAVAVPAPDEDALTMAATAGERALSAAGVDGADLAGLAFATTTPPVAEEDLTPRLGAALGVPADATTRYAGRSTRAGTRALRAARDAGAFPTLVVAADCPRGKPGEVEGQAAGAGAAAVVLGDPATPGARLLGDAEVAADYPGTRFRRPGTETVEGLGVSAYDRRAFVRPVAAAVDVLGGNAADGDPSDTAPDIGDPTEVDALAITAPDGDRPARAARAIGIDSDAVATPVDRLGDLGAAGPLVGLATALRAGATRTLLVGWGSGAGADALLVSGVAPVEGDTEADPDATASYPEALRLRGEITTDEPPAGGGAAVSVPTWRRSIPARYRLRAGRCPDCGALAFPPEGACPDCHSLVEYEAAPLPSVGTIQTVTGVTPGSAPPEFARQAARGGDYAVAIVAFERDGRSVSVPMQVCAADPDDASAGDAVRAVFRRVYEQEGVVRYGRKAVPA
ncbi:zinc ribbon domain-containing protein [Halobaculum sp. CBA1158]|uniref:zinc ribbon domain-containing protein n=1 Tax=Halobaculum sp. CBA1158 TaxID=2904243 RepID=UPI001F3070B4|nr:zinc ribbon domain-containing protein [Halobaculum sp. CBA1158]UIO98678.1 zinc ribbon domain-containing protein [Halobaculum sp. CBA1158]